MNKFFALTVLACVCAVANAATITDLNEELPSEFSFVTNDQEEVAQLPENLRVFEDFCLASRDFVLSDVKSSTDRVTANVFNVFFNSAEEVGKEASSVSSEATEKLRQQLAKPESAVNAPTDNEVDQIIADGQSKIQSQNQAQALLTAFKTVFAATSSKVGAMISERMENLKKIASLEQLGMSLAESCDMVKNYEDQIRAQLEEYKVSALNNDAKYAELKLDDVRCTTARRIIRIEGACKFVMAIRPTVAEYLTTTPATVE